MTALEERAFDLVVVGAGTGLLAALAAAEAGLSVLVVEKSAYVGGSTALSGGGIWVPGNSVLREAGVVDSPVRIRQYLRQVTAEQVPSSRWEPFVTHGPAAVDLLRRRTPLRLRHMAGSADYFPEAPGGSAVGRAVEPKPFDLRRLGGRRGALRPAVLTAPVPMPVTGTAYRWLSLLARHPRGVLAGASALGVGVGGLALRREYAAGGQALAAGLFAGALAADLEIWTETPLVDLVLQRAGADRGSEERVGEGRVSGVVVRRGGREVRVRAGRGVVLAAGGFDRDLALRRRHQCPDLRPEWCFGSPDNTGEVLHIAQAAGADLAFLDESWWFPAVPLPAGPSPLLAERSLPGQVIVNGRGCRFLNEAASYMRFGQAMVARHTPRDPHIPAWIVFDQTYRNRYLFAASLLPRQPVPRGWYDAGVAHRAGSIAALAAAVGLPELPATVERFNLLAAAGHDDDFGRGDGAYDRYFGDPTVRPNPCLGPIETGPFYAVQVVPGDLGTCGGVRADGLARALRPDGSVIEGLYAVGNAAGNAFGRAYPGPGATLGQGLTYGYIAARHAAGLLHADR